MAEPDLNALAGIVRINRHVMTEQNWGQRGFRAGEAVFVYVP